MTTPLPSERAHGGEAGGLSEEAVARLTNGALSAALHAERTEGGTHNVDCWACQAATSPTILDLRVEIQRLRAELANAQHVGDSLARGFLNTFDHLTEARRPADEDGLRASWNAGYVAGRKDAAPTSAPAGGDPVRDRLAATCAALRREIGPPTDRDATWQPMVSAAEVRLLLDEIDRQTALLADERTAAAREALEELRRATDVIAMLSPSPNHDECELSIRRTAMNNIADALGADDAR